MCHVFNQSIQFISSNVVHINRYVVLINTLQSIGKDKAEVIIPIGCCPQFY